jgi:hypothetical protein
MELNEQQYIRGFNHGYLMSKHLPDLVVKLIKNIKETTNDYLAGFFSGKEEYEHEMSKSQLNELKQMRHRANDKDLEIDR